MANTHSLQLASASNQYAYITDANQTGLDLTGDFTFECFLKLSSQPATGVHYTIASKWVTGSNGYIVSYSDFSGTKYLRIVLRDGTNSTSTEKIIAQTLNTGTWYHIAVVYDASAGSAEWYVNGKSIGTVTGLPTSVNNSSADFVLGDDANHSGSADYDGLIDDVRVWNDIRTANEILVNMDTELTGTEANLQGYWKFNNDYTDSTSNGNDLTAVNSPVFSTDASFMDRSIDLVSSSSQYLSFSGISGATYGTQGTIMAWVKVSATTGSNQGVYDDWDINPYKLAYLNLDSTLKVIAGRGGSTTSTVTSTNSVSTGTWTHIAMTFKEGAGTKVYIDGVLDTTSGTNLVSANTNASNGGRIGCVWYNGTNDRFFNGLIDEVRVYNVELTQSQIQSAKNSEIANDTTGLVGYWKMENNYIDSSGNGNLLTPTNSPVFSTDEGWVVTPTATENAIFFGSNF
ncbi:LamG domain-containing protein [Persephonella sp.]